MPSPVPVPLVTPAGSSPGAGGTKPKTPALHARSACPASANSAMKAVIDLALDVAASSALHAAGVDVKSEIAPEVAPATRSCSHWVATRDARFASALARVVM